MLFCQRLLSFSLTNRLGGRVNYKSNRKGYLMKIKKFIIILLALCLVLSMAGCGGSGGSDDNGGGNGGGGGDDPVSSGPLCFTANAASTIQLYTTTGANPSLEYSTDGSTWQAFEMNHDYNLASGSKFYLRGIQPISPKVHGLSVWLQQEHSSAHLLSLQLTILTIFLLAGQKLICKKQLNYFRLLFCGQPFFSLWFPLPEPGLGPA